MSFFFLDLLMTFFGVHHAWFMMITNFQLSWVLGRDIFLEMIQQHPKTWHFNNFCTLRQLHEDLRLLKDLGANFVRGAHYSHLDKGVSCGSRVKPKPGTKNSWHFFIFCVSKIHGNTKDDEFVHFKTQIPKTVGRTSAETGSKAKISGFWTSATSNLELLLTNFSAMRHFPAYFFWGVFWRFFFFFGWTTPSGKRVPWFGNLRYGILVWEETVAWQPSLEDLQDPQFMALQVQSLEETIDASMNHPSATQLKLGWSKKGTADKLVSGFMWIHGLLGSFELFFWYFIHLLWGKTRQWMVGHT